MVRGIIIPADNSASLTAATFETLDDYRQIVGGWIEAVDIPNLGASLYVNEEGLVRGLPYNRRATFLWWFGVPQARGVAMLVGDAVLTGLPNTTNESLDVPAGIHAELLEPGTYRVWIRDHGDAQWHPEPIERDDYMETVIWATLVLEISPDSEVRIIRSGGSASASDLP